MKKIFKNTQIALINNPTDFPSGLSVKTDKGIYWIKDNKRYRLISNRAWKSWTFTTVDATESALLNFKIAGKLGFRDGTLIKDISNGKLYLISQNKKRHIVSPDVFTKYGLDKSKIVDVSTSESQAHEIGEDLW